MCSPHDALGPLSRLRGRAGVGVPPHTQLGMESSAHDERRGAFQRTGREALLSLAVSYFLRLAVRLLANSRHPTDPYRDDVI
jgi:hypothetical protein